MYISILHPFLCSSCKYFKQNKCVKLEIIYVYHHHCSRNIAYTSMNLCLLLVAIVVNCVAVKVDILKINLFEFTSNHIQNCCEGWYIEGQSIQIHDLFTFKIIFLLPFTMVAIHAKHCRRTKLILIPELLVMNTIHWIVAFHLFIHEVCTDYWSDNYHDLVNRKPFHI